MMMNETIKLNPEDKRKWVEALRSGRFVQGQHVLHNAANDTYCCLGVAREVCSLSSSSHTMLRDVYSEYIFLSKKTQDFLSRQNDSVEAPWNFAQIADWIEINL